MRFTRTEQLIGAEALKKLQEARVAVFGIGGVGGYVAETIARAGVGNITLIDKDDVEESNINRQIIALTSSVGKSKAELMADRIRDVNPQAKVVAKKMFYLPETADEIDLKDFDYVADAIDNVTAKIELIERAKNSGVKIISAMGAGNKLHPEKLQIADIEKTSVCALARVVRKKLREKNIKGVTVAFSTEEPIAHKGVRTPASMMAVPAVMGIMMAEKIILDLIQEEQ